MNRTISNKNKPSHKVIIFWSLIALLTLSFIGLVIYRFISTREANISDNLINLSEEQVLGKEGTYYIYVYSRVGVTEGKLELEKADELEISINKYITYVKNHSNVNKIYGMVVDSGTGTYGNNSRLVDGDSAKTVVENVDKFENLWLHVDDIPILMKIENGKVTKAYLTANAIKEELDKAMELL
ncbi:MAG: hypothetical protein PHX62_05620 [Bacilli bacterium]|nr:hypothetical protein [Bacilli bacterium]